MIQLLADRMGAALLGHEKCPCNDLENDEHGAILAGTAVAIHKQESPSLAFHTLLYMYLIGKQVAEEQMLNKIFEETEVK